eukprot:GHVS01006730.1.p1 GENE.GHVS01006730.1~~GHVS01006730.1.p1  ORF type:complete len:243 (+),score=14.85 GHVS01006730.1:430-1158(+)
MRTIRLFHCYSAIYRSLQALPQTSSHWFQLPSPSGNAFPDLPLCAGEFPRLDQPTDPSVLALYHLHLHSLVPPRLPSPPRQPFNLTPLSVARGSPEARLHELDRELVTPAGPLDEAEQPLNLTDMDFGMDPSDFNTTREETDSTYLAADETGLTDTLRPVSGLTDVLPSAHHLSDSLSSDSSIWTDLSVSRPVAARESAEEGRSANASSSHVLFSETTPMTSSKRAKVPSRVSFMVNTQSKN